MEKWAFDTALARLSLVRLGSENQSPSNPLVLDDACDAFD